MKNKKILLSILVLALMFGFNFSVQAVTYSTQTFIAEAIFEAPQITHSAVTNVSSVNRNLNIEVTVNFGVYTSSQVDLLYYFDGNPSTMQTVSKSDISNGQPFYIETGTFDTGHNSISYQIRAKLTNQSGAEGYAYWPEDQSVSSDTFHTATISNSTSTVIGSEGGTLIIDDGNQGTGDSGVTVDPGTLDPGTIVIIEDLDFDDWFPAMNINRTSFAVSNGKPISGISVRTEPPQDTFDPPITVFLSMKDSTATSFIVMYRKDSSVPEEEWENVKIYKVDFSDGEEGRRVYVKATKAGQYLLFAGKEVENKDYRPAKRVRVKSRISTYGGFKFNNLKDGDVVKIYTVSGKKVAELTSGNAEGFEWRGREGTNNSGDWAKSGTYIYQIKLKEKSKVISGTIAFVW
jgi:hypothetical protein